MHEAMDEETAEAECIAAMELVIGEKVPRDPARAAAMFGKAAAAGHAVGHFGLAELLMAGDGIARDEELALMHYREAAADGHPGAMYRLATLMLEDGPSQDIPGASALFLRCAEAGMAAAYAVAGDIRFQGLTGEADAEAAYRWYRLAAEAGDPSAMFSCGYMSEAGIGTAVDEAEALRMFERSAAAGLAEAQFKMAALAREGKAPGGSREALRWYRVCSDRGYPAATISLATMLLEGDGTDRDPETAFSLYSEVAAETGDADAHFMVGRMLLEGIGTEADPEAGLRAMAKAAAAGNEAARQLVEGLGKRGGRQPIVIDGTGPAGP